MSNLRLNFGGLFGGLVGAGATIAIIYLLSNGGDFRPRYLKLVALAAFGGAALGNWIWSLAQPRDDAFN
jgi:hypothetical protein